MTARWVVDIAPERDIQVTWKSISLLFKNEPDPESPYYERVVKTHNMLRVWESVKKDEGEAAVDALYLELGRRIHHDKDVDFAMTEALTAAGIDTRHATAFDDDSWDPVIRAAMDEGLSYVGDDVGTPIITFDGASGERKGLFGPVITKVPPRDQGLKLWDAMIDLGNIDGFWELKKTRTERPDFGERP